jgi:hypothetical protein
LCEYAAAWQSSRKSTTVITCLENICQRRVERTADGCDDIGQRMSEVLVLAAPEAVARHHHPAAEPLACRIEPGERAAFVRREQRGHDGIALRVEAGGQDLPIQRLDPCRDPWGRRRRSGAVEPPSLGGLTGEQGVSALERASAILPRHAMAGNGDSERIGRTGFSDSVGIFRGPAPEFRAS